MLAALVAATVAAAAPSNDHLLVLDRRAGPYHYLDSFTKGHTGAYEAALAAYGEPSNLKSDGNLCRVTWRPGGVTVGFASELQPCATGHLYEAAWYGLTLVGPGWHTRTGIHIGSTLAEVRRASGRVRTIEVPAAYVY